MNKKSGAQSGPVAKNTALPGKDPGTAAYVHAISRALLEENPHNIVRINNILGSQDDILWSWQCMRLSHPPKTLGLLYGAVLCALGGFLLLGGWLLHFSLSALAVQGLFLALVAWLVGSSEQDRYTVVVTPRGYVAGVRKNNPLGLSWQCIPLLAGACGVALVWAFAYFGAKALAGIIFIVPLWRLMQVRNPMHLESVLLNAGIKEVGVDIRNHAVSLGELGLACPKGTAQAIADELCSMVRQQGGKTVRPVAMNVFTKF